MDRCEIRHGEILREEKRREKTDKGTDKRERKVLMVHFRDGLKSLQRFWREASEDTAQNQ